MASATEGVNAAAAAVQGLAFARPAILNDKLQWRPETYVEKRFRLRAGMAAGVAEGSSRRSSILMRRKSGEGGDVAEVAGSAHERARPPGGTKQWRPAGHVMNEARLEAAKSAVRLAMGQPLGSSEMVDAVHRYRSLGLHDFDSPPAGADECQAADKSRIGLGRPGSSSMEKPSAVDAAANSLSPTRKAAAGGTAVDGKKTLAEVMRGKKASKLPPISAKGRGGKALGGSVSALLSKSRATRKALRNRVIRTLNPTAAHTPQPTPEPSPRAEEAQPSSEEETHIGTDECDECMSPSTKDCRLAPTTAAELAAWVPVCTCDKCTQKSQVRWLRMFDGPQDDEEEEEEEAGEGARAAAVLMYAPSAAEAAIKSSPPTNAPVRGLLRRLSSKVGMRSGNREGPRRSLRRALSLSFTSRRATRMADPPTKRTRFARSRSLLAFGSRKRTSYPSADTPKKEMDWTPVTPKKEMDWTPSGRRLSEASEEGTPTGGLGV